MKGFLELDFSWTPPSAVDVKVLVIWRGIDPTVAGLTSHLVGGEYCRRVLHHCSDAHTAPLQRKSAWREPPERRRATPVLYCFSPF